jgi:hypothetical protein
VESEAPPELLLELVELVEPLELVVEELLPPSLLVLDAADDDSPEVLEAGLDVDGPLAEAVEARESVMYQPLPLKTMPTG